MTQTKKWRCDCGEVFHSDVYIPFEILPKCPKCDKKVCTSIPKCVKCGKDGMIWSDTIGTMHCSFSPMCPEHLEEFKKQIQNLFHKV